MIHIIATSHGTNNQQGRQSISLIRQELAAVLQESLPGKFLVHEAYVDVQEPALDRVVANFSQQERLIIVPLLLSAGYHTEVDIKRAAALCPAQVCIAGALGPSADLAKLQRSRINQTGWDGRGDCLMAAAGSSRGDGRDAALMQADVLSALLARPVPHGFIADIEPRIAELIGRLRPAVISSYLLAEGHFQQKLKGLAQEGSCRLTAPLVTADDRQAARVVAQVALQRIEENLD